MRRHLRLRRIFTTPALALAFGAFALLMSQSVADAPTGFNTPTGCPPVPAADNQGAPMTITSCPTTINGPNGLVPPMGWRRPVDAGRPRGETNPDCQRQRA